MARHGRAEKAPRSLAHSKTLPRRRAPSNARQHLGVRRPSAALATTPHRSVVVGTCGEESETPAGVPKNVPAPHPLHPPHGFKTPADFISKNAVVLNLRETFRQFEFRSPNSEATIGPLRGARLLVASRPRIRAVGTCKNCRTVTRRKRRAPDKGGASRHCPCRFGAVSRSALRGTSGPGRG